MSTSKSKNKKERKKINDDIALLWLNWSVVTINITFLLLFLFDKLPCINQNKEDTGKASSLQTSTRQCGRLAELKKQDKFEARLNFAAVWAAKLQLLQTQIKSQATKLTTKSRMSMTKWEMDHAEHGSLAITIS